MVDETNVATIGIAPEGAVLAETPETSAPGVHHHLFGTYGSWLGDPKRRYGLLTIARNIPITVKLEMLRDPIVALSLGFIGSALQEADRVVECADESKRRFFEAMFEEWAGDFLAHAALAVVLGSCGFVKRFAFRVPQPVEILDEPVWRASTKPFIITGLEPVYPVDSSPRFDRKRKHFEGMSTPDGNIDAFYSLWLTMGKQRAFGDYKGSGRLENIYRDWWAKMFARDNYLVWLQKNVNPVVKVRYPKGTTQGKSHQAIALETGNSIRSGATVALSSDTYVVTGMTGDEQRTQIYRWDVEFMKAVGSFDEFERMDNHHDHRIALGMLMPPQMFMDVKQAALGGPTTADVLTNLAQDLLMMDAVEVDRHINEYVFPPVERANFPAGSPRVRVRTMGLSQESREQLFRIMDTLLKRSDLIPPVDVRGGLDRLGIPLVGEGEAQWSPRPASPMPPVGMAGGDDQVVVEDDVLREIVRTPLPSVSLPDSTVGERDIIRALRKLQAAVPELDLFSPHLGNPQEGEGEG